MEGRIAGKVEQHQINFKNAVVGKIMQCDAEQDLKQMLCQYIYDFPILKLEKDDFAKRKRVTNVVPFYERCCARRAEGGEQCTRKRRDGSLFCGTHIKGTPHGVIEDGGDNEPQNKQIEVIAKEIQGIIYYIDNNENVYRTEDVVHNKKNPQIIAKYITNMDGSISIPAFSI